MAKNKIQVSIYLDPLLHKWVEGRAREEERSVSQCIAYLVRAAKSPAKAGAVPQQMQPQVDTSGLFGRSTFTDPEPPVVRRPQFMVPPAEPKKPVATREDAKHSQIESCQFEIPDDWIAHDGRTYGEWRDSGEDNGNDTWSYDPPPLTAGCPAQ